APPDPPRPAPTPRLRLSPSSARPAVRAGGWHLAGWPALDRLPADLLSPRSRAVSPVPPPLPQDAPDGARGWPTRFLWQSRRTRGHKSIRRLPRAAAQDRLGSLCQGAVRRAAGRALLPV